MIETRPGESSLLLLVDSLAASAAFRRFVSVIMMSSFQIWHYSTHFLQSFCMNFSVFFTQFFLFCQSINLHFFVFQHNKSFGPYGSQITVGFIRGKKAILFTAFGQDDNFDIMPLILWRHNLISTVLLHPTVGFRLGLLHQQSQGLTASLALLEALHTKTPSLTFLAFTRPLETKAKRSLTQLNAKRSNYTLHQAK